MCWTRFLRDLAGEHRPKPVPPQPHRLMADVDAALEQQVLDIAQHFDPNSVHPHQSIISL
jgi:hypothetical protein